MLHQLVQVLNLGTSTGTSKYITGRGTSTWLPSNSQFPYKFRFATRGAVRPRVARPRAAAADPERSMERSGRRTR